MTLGLWSLIYMCIILLLSDLPTFKVLNVQTCVLDCQREERRVLWNTIFRNFSTLHNLNDLDHTSTVYPRTVITSDELQIFQQMVESTILQSHFEQYNTVPEVKLIASGFRLFFESKCSCNYGTMTWQTLWEASMHSLSLRSTSKTAAPLYC